jgi:hypothetical protein
MKSGNTLIMNDVEIWNIKYKGNVITDISITWGEKKKENIGVIVGSLDLSQIEAIESI